jgi:hypothetical protein
MPTQAPHCYGPHGDHCHTNEACSGGSDSESGSGNRKDHQVVNNDVQSRPVGAAAQMVAPQVLLAILPMLFASEETKVPASYCVDFGESPPFGVTVARTIVLLI